MKKTIMILDNSNTMLLTLRNGLEEAGYIVETYIDYNEAFDMIEHGFVPHLILTDLDVPNIDGVELIVKLRKYLRTVPLYVLTSERCEIIKEKVKQSKASGWISKPLEMDRILEIVNKILSKK